MKTLKVTFYSLLTASCMAVSPVAFANSTNATNTTNAFLGHTPSKDSEIQHLRLFDVSALPLRGERYLGSSRTATLYYKKGVKSFEKGKFEKAASHFRASLRADGSRGLDKNTLHYLVNINHKLGDEKQAKTYADAYFALVGK
jgi:hypothetical protein